MFQKAKVHYQLSVEELIAQTINRKEGTLSNTGALVINTGEFTGRSPADKFIVRDGLTALTVDWNKFNNPIAEAHFTLLKEDLIDYLDTKKEVWIRNACACAAEEYNLNLRIVTEAPSSNLFAANMFIKPGQNKQPVWTIIQAPGFKADPIKHGTRQGNFTVVSFTHRIILIGGSAYTGEIKKSVFTVLNYVLPIEFGVLPMHCSVNEGAGGDAALFFGLSGTGKTTLSSDPNRKLIGDDEHGWDNKGIFNMEGGCYAKVINLSKEKEPDIFHAIKGGALVENTVFKENTNEIDYSSGVITENTRVSYPIDFIANSKKPSITGVPKHIFFLTCDAFGVLPPISVLTEEQAMFYFTSGYTAKIAGTEAGVKSPSLTFSPCFGAPFLPLEPAYYARLLQEKLQNHQTRIWMVNTGWTGGRYGTGKRIDLTFTRSMVTAALLGELENGEFEIEQAFGLRIPKTCNGVPAYLLNPYKTWTDIDAYNKAAKELKDKFRQNSGGITITDVNGIENQ
jgi:phosphoenolpyruvate carboxykinase (ATP)